MSLTIKIPAIQKEWQVPSNQPSWRNQAIAILKKNKDNYLAQFQRASDLSGVNIDILLGFASVESMGARNETLSRGSAIGLFQVQPPTVYDTLKKQLNSTTLGLFYPLYLGCPSIFTIKKTLAKDFWGSQNAKERQDPASDYFQLKSNLDPEKAKQIYGEIKKCILADSQWSIYVGATVLSQLINGTIKKTGQIRLDHIIIKYNAGIGTFANRVTKTGLESSNTDTTQLLSKANLTSETKAYIIKLLGINGFLDILKQKAV